MDDRKLLGYLCPHDAAGGELIPPSSFCDPCGDDLAVYDDGTTEPALVPHNASPKGDGPSIDDLIERSSLGSPEAKALRKRTPPEVVERIMRKVEERTNNAHCSDQP